MSRRPSDARAAAEAAFKPKKPAPPPPPKVAAAPGARELVSVRVDREVLEFFQEDGPGWQDRINAALRDYVGQKGGLRSQAAPADPSPGRSDDGA